MNLQFRKYLIDLHHTPETIESYVHSIRRCLADNPSLERFTYGDVVEYLNLLARQGSTNNTRTSLLYSMKKYFDFLIDSGKIENHPCRGLFIRNQRDTSVIGSDLFTPSELEVLMEREERYSMLALRNRVVVSLLIYQGLHSREICNLDLHHVDMDKGVIFVRSTSKVNQRHLEVESRQYRLFAQYLETNRKRLNLYDSKAFLLGKLGARIKTEDIHYLISTFKKIFPNRKLTPATIRQSVIANWLNGSKIPLEQVQLLSGQKWTSTTARYKLLDMEEQRKLMNLYYPLNGME